MDQRIKISGDMSCDCHVIGVIIIGWSLLRKMRKLVKT